MLNPGIIKPTSTTTTTSCTSGIYTPCCIGPCTTTTTTTTTGVPMDISFNSYVAPFTYGQNFPTPGNSIQVQVPNAITINMVQFSMSDRAYDPNNETFYFQTSGGQTLATGTLSEWGPYGMSGDNSFPIPLSQIITLQANTPYRIVFSQLPSTDKYGCSLCNGVSQDLLQEQAPASGGYLGQSQWPLFQLGLMNVLPSTSGMAIHNYGAYTDFFSSPGYQGNTESGMRFLAGKTEQLVSFEIYAMKSDGSNNPLVFTLRSDSTSGGNGGSHPTPLSVAPALATASIPMSQVAANLTYNGGNEITGQYTFIKVYLSAPLQQGSYYWIVMASPNGVKGVDLGRLVNPYRELVLNSGDDFQSWGVPADGPTDFGFKVTTTQETINNALIATPKFNYFNQLAQSFIPNQATQVKGAWIQARPAGQNLYVSIQRDSGTDSPSGNAVLQGVTGAVQGIKDYRYVPFNSVATLNAGTKYWLVYKIGACLTASCSAPNSAYAIEYRSDMYGTAYDYGGTAVHFEINGGSGWFTDATLGDMNMILVGPTTSG